MGQSAPTGCKVCSPSDPTADTVRVNANLIPPESPTAQKPVDEEQREGGSEEEARRREQEEARLEDERRQADEAEAERRRQEDERLRREKEDAERQRREEAARAEKAAREERERAAEAARVKAEQERAAAAAEAAAAKAREEVAAAQQAVNDFLKANGFKGIALPRKAFCGGSLYPLHAAVEENQPEIVKALLLCRADQGLKNSAKKTPLELAEKCNKTGSHEMVLTTLRRGV